VQALHRRWQLWRFRSWEKRYLASQLADLFDVWWRSTSKYVGLTWRWSHQRHELHGLRIRGS